MINSATCSDNFDIVFTDDGFVSVEDTTHSSLANMLKLDFVSNDDWVLDPELGVHWLSAKNDGLLQVKGSEIEIISSIQRKLLGIKGVKEISNVEIARSVDRRLFIKITVISDDDGVIEIVKEQKREEL